MADPVTPTDPVVPEFNITRQQIAAFVKEPRTIADLEAFFRMVREITPTLTALAQTTADQGVADAGEAETNAQTAITNAATAQAAANAAQSSADAAEADAVAAQATANAALAAANTATDALSWKQPVRAKKTAALAANTYANGSSGVGATLTGNSNGALGTVDGVTLAVGERLLVDQEASGSHNGIYKVTQLGDGSHPYILTRTTDADTSAKLVNATVMVSEGSTFADQEWQCTTNATITVGTTALVFAKAAIGDAPQDGTLYVRQNGAWVAAGAGTSSAAWAVAGTWTWSTNVTSVDLTGLGTYNELLVIARGLTTSAATFRVFRVGVGGTFYSTSGNYAVLSNNNAEVSTDIIAGTGVSASTAQSLMTHILNNLNGQTKVGINSLGVPIFFTASTSPIDAIRLTTLSGANITAGSMVILGR
jgi:hypothetical protein